MKAYRRHCHLIYSTVVSQYFPPDKKPAGQGYHLTGRLKIRKPSAWLKIEADGDGPGAGMQLDLSPNNERINLGRMDFYGRWVD
tara:strand:- start:5488 stop:5739 length:252 start_codon:yes stop_codon:yes gene_type:complete